MQRLLNSAGRHAKRTHLTPGVISGHSAVRGPLTFARPASSPPVEWESKEVDPQLQDYPDLPATSYQRRKPGGWDDEQNRRNFGEPIPEEHEVLSVWSYDHYAMSGGEALKQFSMAALAFAILIGGIASLVPEKPAVSRQYPFDGLVKELGGIEDNKADSESAEEDD